MQQLSDSEQPVTLGFCQAGADLAAADAAGITPAHMAAQNGHVEALRALLQAPQALPGGGGGGGGGASLVEGGGTQAAAVRCRGPGCFCPLTCCF